MRDLLDEKAKIISVLRGVEVFLVEDCLLCK